MLVIGFTAASLVFGRTETTTQALTTTSTVFSTVSMTSSFATQIPTNLSSLCPSSSPELNASSPYPYGEGVQPISFHLNENSSMYACVAFYYYNETAPITIDPLNYISLSGRINNSASSDNALANFSLISSSQNLTIGNTEDAREGLVITFLIHSRPISNGTYNFNLAWTFSSAPYTCTLDYYLVVGNLLSFSNYYP